MELALGTAQFGLDYGITNSQGRVAASEAGVMLEQAWTAGVRRLDTAPAYGTSEATLGSAFGSQPRPWQVITKTLPLRTATVSAEQLLQVDAAFQGSLQQLGAVHTLLVHHADDLLVPGGQALYAWLQAQKEAGRMHAVGASVYDAAQVGALLERFRLDVVQLPASIADQRLLADGTVQRLADAGIDIHVRSLFLQGVLLADPAFVGARFPVHAAWAQRFHDECRSRGVSPAQACFGFFRAQPAFRVAIAGAASSHELGELLAAWASAPPMDWAGWAVDNPAFTDPRHWPPN